MLCTLSPELTVERRIATVLSNQQERDRIIALKAYEAFCRRGCEHGADLDDWLNAERELSSEPNDVSMTTSEGGIEISIANRVHQDRIFLSIAPSSLLVLWDGAEVDSSGDNSTLSLVSLPEVTDPARAEVTYCDGRLRLRLPYQDQHNAHA